MSTDDKRIREFAYQIWESEGKPAGQENRHWEMARKLAEAEALAPSKPPKAASKSAASKTDGAKPAAAKSTTAKTAAKNHHAQGQACGQSGCDHRRQEAAGHTQAAGGLIHPIGLLVRWEQRLLAKQVPRFRQARIASSRASLAPTEKQLCPT